MVEVANKQPPSKTSTRMLVFDGKGGGGGKQAATIEIERAYARFRWWRYGGGGDGGSKQAEEGTAPP